MYVHTWLKEEKMKEKGKQKDSLFDRIIYVIYTSDTK